MPDKDPVEIGTLAVFAIISRWAYAPPGTKQTTQEVARTAITAALAALSAEGFAVVPREPSEAMCRAYFEASTKAAHEDFGVPLLTWDGLEEDQVSRLRSFGRAMLAAAERENGGADGTL